MLLHDFNKTVGIWLHELPKYDYQSLTQRPDPSSWSLGQVYIHLINETNWYFEQLERCFTYPNNTDEAIAESAKHIFENNSFDAIRIKGDSLSSENVPQPKDLESIESDLVNLKNKAAQLWLRINSNEKRGKSEHPGIKFLSPTEWLHFSEMHMRHHLEQKNRIDEYFKK